MTGDSSDPFRVPVGGNGLVLPRRNFIGAALAIAGGAGLSRASEAKAVALRSPESMTVPGELFVGYGAPGSEQQDVVRVFPSVAGREGSGSARTPLARLEGTITPNGLHFTRNHNGTPIINADRHELLIHGLVSRPLSFTRETLLRYPLESRRRFIECAGNTAINASVEASAADATALFGLFSCAEWTGVPLSILLDEAGVDPNASWVLAEGADAAAVSRSIPLSKIREDAMVALFQNGEALRPEQGYPMRLLVPGFEGIVNIKWLRRLKLVDGPAGTKDETSRYTELMHGGKARQYMMQMGVKSAILKPSPQVPMREAGYYEISGLAWSGAGTITKVEVSADGGRSWALATLSNHQDDKAPARFRIGWQWNGGPCVLMSRATDSSGDVQPDRSSWLSSYAPGQNYHYNAIHSWAVDRAGQVRNVYA